MGEMLCFICDKCGESYYGYLGVGWMAGSLMEQAMEEISMGKWGPAYKEQQEKREIVVPDINRDIYICSDCGRWYSKSNMNLYAPKRPKDILKEKFGIKTVEEWGYVPFVTKDELAKSYKLIETTVHKCECGNNLHLASKKERKNLACPKCGRINKTEGLGYWD